MKERENDNVLSNGLSRYTEPGVVCHVDFRLVVQPKQIPALCPVSVEVFSSAFTIYYIMRALQGIHTLPTRVACLMEMCSVCIEV